MSENIDRELWNSAIKHERERMRAILDEEERIGHAILAKEDCNADCYKCDISGHTTIKTVSRIRDQLFGEN